MAQLDALAKTILNSERWNAFLLRLGRRPGCILLTIAIQIVLEVLATAIKQEKELNKISFTRRLHYYLNRKS